MTPHASDMLGPRNVVPYYEIPVYNTTGFQYLLSRLGRGHAVGDGTFPSPESRILYSSSIQLTCIIDKTIMCVRKSIGARTCDNTDNYATFKNISINFNNQASLLSSMTPEQLYINYVQSGLVSMRWGKFCGPVISCCGATNGNLRPHPEGPYKGLAANLQAPEGQTQTKFPIHTNHGLHPEN